MIVNLLAVARREFRSYFDHATAYILLVIFLVANFFFYFRGVMLTGEATLRPMFDLLPWLLLFFVPAITMRALAEERASGTLELILAQPIREIEFLLGKFLGILGFLTVALLGTGGAIVALHLGGHPYTGVIVSQYVGALLLMGGLVAIGLWSSSLTQNQITAFIVGVAVIFLFMALTLDVVLLGLPPLLAAAAQRLGVITHFNNIARGVIDLRDVVYFLSLQAAFLSLAYWSIQRERLNRKGMPYRSLWAGTVGILGICVTVNLLGGHIRGRLDLTPGNAYTLSPATRSVLKDLPDLVTVKLFASKELPPQIGTVKRDIEDMLADYRSVAGDQLRVETYKPEGENDAKKEAENMNIPPVQFNVIGNEEFQVKKGYLGIAIQYAAGTETLPFVRQTDDLEYRLTSAIRRLTVVEKPIVGFLTGHGEHAMTTDYRTVAAQIKKDYTTEPVDITKEGSSIPAGASVLVIAGPSSPLSETEGDKLRSYLNRGGNLLLAYQPLELGQTPFPEPQPHPVLDEILNLYGVGIVDGMAYDLRANGRVNLPSASGFQVVVPYPLWPQVHAASNHVTVDKLTSVLMPWVSPLDLTATDSTAVIPLLSTTRFGGRLTGRFPLSPQFDWNSLGQKLSPELVAAAVLPPALAAGKDSGQDERGGTSAHADSAGVTPSAASMEPRGRLVVIGDADFAVDRFVGANRDNLAFFQNVIDWLAQDNALISIRTKSRTPPPLLYASATVRDAAKYLNLVGVPLLFVLIGGLRLFRRRRLHSRRYRPADLA